MANLYTASNILRRTFILKAEKLSWTCDDLTLTSDGQTGNRLQQTRFRASEDLSVETIPFLELCYVRDTHLREQKKMNFRIEKRDFYTRGQ